MSVATKSPKTAGRPSTWRSATRLALAMVAMACVGLGAGAGAHAWGNLDALTWTSASVQAGEPVAAPAALPTPAKAPRTGPMSHKVMLGLVRTTLGAVGNAIDTGNYTVLREMGAPGFREANGPERLAEIFEPQRKARVDLSGIMFTEPVITIEPRIEATGLMRVAGHFPAGASSYEFDLLFKPEGNRWRLFGISTGVVRTDQVAEAATTP